MNIPEGYKLVPIYPTEDMVSAVIDLGRIDPDDVDSIWSGMIENSPFICESNSSAYDEAKERELFEVYALEILGPYFMKPQDCLTRSGGTYTYGQPATAWCAWQSCAKSRARSAE